MGILQSPGPTITIVGTLTLLPSATEKGIFVDSTGAKLAIGYQKEIKKTLGKTSETDAYLKFEMTSYVKCQTDL